MGHSVLLTNRVSHGDTGCAQAQGGCKAVAVRASTCRDDGNLHVGGAATGYNVGSDTVGGGMAASLIAGNDNTVHTLAFHAHGDLVVGALVEVYKVCRLESGIYGTGLSADVSMAATCFSPQSLMAARIMSSVTL